MSLFNRLRRSLSGGGSEARTPAYWLYVRCDRCGSPVAVRINLFNDPSLDEEGGYVLRKEIIDNKCFRLIVAELKFDENRHVVAQQIEGGRFISKEEYDSLLKGSLESRQ